MPLARSVAIDGPDSDPAVLLHAALAAGYSDRVIALL